jgi:hypothetical protein
MWITDTCPGQFCPGQVCYNAFMSWGTTRRNTVLFTLLLFIGIPAGAIAFIIFYEPANCFDGKQNSTETGIDCGGTCSLLCTSQVTEPVVLWEKAFRVSDGMYNLLAYIENPNPSAFLKDVQYVFKIYNEDGVMIGEKSGTTSIAPKSARPIIQSNIQTFEQIPVRTTFEFVGELVYEQTEPKDSLILIKDEIIENETTSPRIKAKIQNISLQTVRKIDVVALIYDVFDNVLGTSSTYVDVLNPEEIKDIVFTWPQSFSDEIGRIELIPIYDFK